jgi:hypothetical protein
VRERSDSTSVLAALRTELLTKLRELRAQQAAAKAIMPHHIWDDDTVVRVARAHTVCLCRLTTRVSPPPPPTRTTGQLCAPLADVVGRDVQTAARVDAQSGQLRQPGARLVPRILGTRLESTASWLIESGYIKICIRNIFDVKAKFLRTCVRVCFFRARSNISVRVSVFAAIFAFYDTYHVCQKHNWRNQRYNLFATPGTHKMPPSSSSKNTRPRGKDAVCAVLTVF